MSWHPYRDAKHWFWAAYRWCRCAQPPANRCEDSGFKTAEARSLISRVYVRSAASVITHAQAPQSPRPARKSATISLKRTSPMTYVSVDVRFSPRCEPVEGGSTMPDEMKSNPGGPQLQSLNAGPIAKPEDLPRSTHNGSHFACGGLKVESPVSHKYRTACMNVCFESDLR